MARNPNPEQREAAIKRDAAMTISLFVTLVLLAIGLLALIALLAGHEFAAKSL